MSVRKIIFDGDVVVGYRTEGGDAIVRVERCGSRFPLDPRLDLANHSPTGFEWGYMGSGPAQLALAICAALAGDSRAVAIYQRFKDTVIAGLPRDNLWTMTAEDARKAIRQIEEAAHVG